MAQRLCIARGGRFAFVDPVRIGVQNVMRRRIEEVKEASRADSIAREASFRSVMSLPHHF